MSSGFSPSALVKLAYNVNLAFESIAHNKTRAVLTSLGIVFGVASVISMLSIGRGAQEEILEQMKLLGTNNVIVKPVVKQVEGDVSDDTQSEAEAERRPFSPGLSLADAQAIEATIPGVAYVSPEIEMETMAIRSGRRRSVKLIGVDQTYFQDGQFELAEGTYFSEAHLADAIPVCVIGQEIKTRFFAAEAPIGKRIKCGDLWLTVIGVLEQRQLDAESLQHLGIRNYNLDIYTPISTQLLRFSDRARLTERDLQADGDAQSGGSDNYHQVDRLVVRVTGTDYVKPVAEVISRMLERRHYGVVDFEVIIPEVLLAQERRTQAIFNVVLAAIASISLIVGGIGIMNIMLASVLERIREIGVRRSIGATKKDVIYQFLVESVAISFTGGVLGILLGVGLSFGIESSTGISTIITAQSVLLAFVVSVTVGLAFGLLPARRAASMDPVEALRHE
ncbi:MAG: ABC transporter permease [Candidatus Eisenbacteria bacterium]|uniref:ABC transporter permease n=1 Tax=Eiseniibacteriota bacterium TaxID=2212470 RepID=A0A956NEC9_UNCEI|nr:ABC transporter permease [Candidatus Eisenbacteria bacterium]MCB9466507.1 ABC transporter permease [Candidatus Eisenbacteria bacterium]